MAGDRVLFSAGTAGRINIWEIRLSPGARVAGVPHQLTFGTQYEEPVSISATGTGALQVGKPSDNLYLIPLSAATGQPTGAVRPLTQDGRFKTFLWYLGGEPGSAYSWVSAGTTRGVYAVDLDSRKQTLISAEWKSAVSPNGRQVVYPVAEGDSYSIHAGETGAGSAAARVLCKACGEVQGFFSRRAIPLL